MDLKVNQELRQVTITLSERNLRAMLHKVTGMGDSARCIVRTMDDGWQLLLRGENDSDHYAQRTPGPMHPLTERVIVRKIDVE